MKEKNHPKEPLLPNEFLEIADRRELLITGVTGIESYTVESVTVKSKCGTVTVKGNDIVLAWAGSAKILIKGQFTHLDFGKSGKETP